MLHEDLCACMISRGILLKIKMFQTKVAEKNKHTFYVQKLFPENSAVCEIK